MTPVFRRHYEFLFATVVTAWIANAAKGIATSASQAITPSPERMAIAARASSASAIKPIQPSPRMRLRWAAKTPHPFIEASDQSTLVIFWRVPTSARALNARRRTNNAGPLAEPDAIDVFAACSAQRWARADCIAREARHTTQVTVPVFTRTRDGRMEMMFVPDRFVAPGFDRTSCMRGLGFVRVRDAAADASNR